MENETLVLYHANCMDGLAAAYAAWLKLGDNNVQYIPVQYGSEPPDVTDKTVYILDFSYPREVLIDMFNKSKYIQVLDHHKTAEEDLKGLPYCKFDMYHSGAMIAWIYFHPKSYIPFLIELIQDRDLWLFRWGDKSKKLHAALSLRYNTLDSWKGAELCRDSKTDELIDLGDILLEQHNKTVEAYAKNAHNINLMGDEGLAVNIIPQYASDMGNVLAKVSGTYGITYFFNGKVWLCSIRSIGDYDVSAIAKKYGGGGHKNASGFTVSTAFWDRAVL